MRIIGGKLKGLRLQPPTGLPVRPTMDLAKEALFNILQNRLDFTGLHALDLFSGTGNITVELASRGAERVVAVDRHFKCVQYLKEVCVKYDIKSVTSIKDNVLTYLKSPPLQGFNLIFADPPFDLPELTQIPQLVLDNNWLLPGGLFILEHPSTKKADNHPAFTEQRKYGYASFSFFTI